MAEPSDVPAAARHLFAGIDVGTNTVKLTIADLANGRAAAVVDMSISTRLGEGMHAQTQRLREAPMRRTIDALEQLMNLAHDRNVEAVAAVGTAALRNAENQEEFLRRVRERCGLAIKVIRGEEEARLSFMAVRRDPHWRAYPHLSVIDIGGGSTEVIQGEPYSERIAARRSINVGAVRLTETVLKSDPPTVAQLTEANAVAAAALAGFDAPTGAQPFHVVGVGGTMTNLGAMDLNGESDVEALHGHTLSVERLETQIAMLASRTVADRKRIPGLDPDRADIILGGAILLSQALARIRGAKLDISTRGLRWGLLYDRFAGA